MENKILQKQWTDFHVTIIITYIQTYTRSYATMNEWIGNKKFKLIIIKTIFGGKTSLPLNLIVV